MNARIRLSRAIVAGLSLCAAVASASSQRIAICFIWMALGGYVSSSYAQGSTSLCDMPSQRGTAMYNKYCTSPAPQADGGGYNNFEYQQEQERQHADEQARQEQLKRDEEERVRQAAEAQRRKEQQQHDAFIADRNATVLKGDTGTPLFGSGGLKGVNTANSGLKGISAAEPAKELRDLSGLHAAWKQLDCAASIASYAIVALQSALDGKTDERDEFKYLSNESSKAMAGETLGVACPAPRALPSRNGQPVDVDKGTIALQRILDRAAKVSERLPARLSSSPQPSSAGTSPSNGSDDLGKLRETQLALNRINERKYDPASQEAINREKQAKQETAALLLAAQKVQTGDFSIDLSEIRSSSPSRSSKNSEKQ